jgi:poly-gamma-glutamate synthesis protein (capsule biosynthesis protein)
VNRIYLNTALLLVLVGTIFYTLYFIAQKNNEAPAILPTEEGPNIPTEFEVVPLVVSTSEAPSVPESTKILIVGDILLDRYIRKVSDAKGGSFIFSCLDSFLADYDFVVGNLEGPITENSSISMGSTVGSPENYIFTFSTTSAELLARHNIKVVNLGNNHIGNFGVDGFSSTKEFLNMAGINYFGGLAGDESIYQRSNISFVSYNEFGGRTFEKVADIIRNEKENGKSVIVYAHWGDEYIDSSPRLRGVATLFAESGADLVVGSHPHVVLQNERILDTVVYYSLGNFIFDQYWNSEVATGLTLALDVRDGKISITEFPVIMNKDGRTCLKN